MKDKDKSQSRLAPIDEDRRLIEGIIPIREMGISGALEKRNRFSNISSLHNWWARKPITVSRSLIFLSSSDFSYRSGYKPNCIAPGSIRSISKLFWASSVSASG